MEIVNHLLLDAAEVDGEAELVVLHRRAGDRRRPRRQRAVHLQEIATHVTLPN